MDTILEEWQSIAQRDKEEGEAYYRENILPNIIQKFSKKKEYRGKYDYLISLVGFSPEPLILMLHAMRPQKTLFLYTPEAKKSLDVIWQYYPFKSPTEHDIAQIDSSNVESVYDEIKKFLKDKSPKKVALDITGGKKAMVSGASAAAALAGCAILYMDYTEYNPELRKPVPGTEFINELKNPIEIFGEIDAEKGKELFNKGNFSAASEVFARLERSVMHPETYQLYQNLAAFFGLWEEYDFSRAQKKLAELNRGIERYRIFTEWREPLKKYEKIIEELVQENVPYYVLNHYFISKRYLQRGKFDFSALLLYRTLEMAVSYRLQEEYQISSGKPNYAPFPHLEEEYSRLIKQVHGKKAWKSNLPIRIGLMDGIILLRALRDAMLPESSALEKIKEQADVRNKSVLAHGVKRVSQKNVLSLERTFLPYLNSFVRIYFGKEKISDFEEWFREIRL